MCRLLAEEDAVIACDITSFEEENPQQSTTETYVDHLGQLIVRQTRYAKGSIGTFQNHQGLKAPGTIRQPLKAAPLDDLSVPNRLFAVGGSTAAFTGEPSCSSSVLGPKRATGKSGSRPNAICP